MAKKSKQSKDKDRDKEPLPQGQSDPEDRPKRVLVFQPEFLEDLTFWVTTNRKNALRVLSLVQEIQLNKIFFECCTKINGNYAVRPHSSSNY